MLKKYNREEFIQEANRIHNNFYIYEDINYVNLETKIYIECPIHGFFEKYPFVHLNSNSGCNKCAQEKKLKKSFDDFVIKANIKYNNKFDYSESVYVNFNTNIRIKCPKHEFFTQTPKTHLKSVYGCNLCRIDNVTYNTPEFIEQSNKIHNNFYNYTKSNYIGINEKIIIICPIHQEFSQRAGAHMKGEGCIKCANDKRRMDNERFIYEAKLVHGDKYDYSKVNYINNDTKVIIVCGNKNHKEFEQSPSNHLAGRGCKQCTVDKQTFSLEHFITKARLTHSNKYNYSKTKYINNYTKIEIVCPNPKHKSFWQNPTDHYYHGCPKCANDQHSIKISDTQEDFIQKCIDTHGDKYDYSLVNYIGAREKIQIICKKHNEVFSQVAIYHSSGSNCQKCARSTVSIQELEWLDNIGILSENRQFTIKINDKRIIADGFDPITNTVYEYHGDYWHGNPKIFKREDINPSTKTSFGELYQNTIDRENLIKSAGYNLVVKWQTDIN